MFFREGKIIKCIYKWVEELCVQRRGLLRREEDHILRREEDHILRREEDHILRRE